MSEAAGKVEQYKSEYDAITSLLTDMEEIDSLVGDLRGNITAQAERIEKLEKERRQAFADAGRHHQHISPNNAASQHKFLTLR